MWLYYLLTSYIIGLGILLGTGKLTKSKNKLYIMLTFGLFVVLAAFRAKNVGNDTDTYLELFETILITEDLSAFTWRYEIGYLYLNKLLSMIVSDPQIIIIVTSLVIMMVFARFIYKYSYIPWLSTFLFFTLGYYGMSMNTIRLNLAIIVILISYDFLRERKLIKFVLIVILASLFHRTAIIFLLAWPMTKLKFNYKTILTMVAVSLSAYVMFPNILMVLIKLFPTYQYYLGSEYLNGELRVASVMNMLVGLSIILLSVFTNYHMKGNEISDVNNKSLRYKNEKINDGHNMLLLLLAGVSITFISFNFNLLERVGDFFLVFSCVFLPNTLRNLKDKNLTTLIIFVVVVLFFAYSTSIQIYRPEWNSIYPYTFFWQ